MNDNKTVSQSSGNINIEVSNINKESSTTMNNIEVSNINKESSTTMNNIEVSNINKESSTTMNDNKTLTELEMIQAKLNLSDETIEKARQDYTNCMIPDKLGNL
jgi:hypothetical protein